MDEKKQPAKHTKEELELNAHYLEYVVEELQRLLENAIEDKNFKLRFHNPDLGKCWELKQCKKTNCPAYNDADQRCWQVAGTFCKGKVQGKFAQKLKDCQKCEIYQKAISTRLYAIGEVFNNMMCLLEENRQQLQDYAQNLEKKVTERTARIEKANKELRSEIRKREKIAAKLRDSEETLRKITSSAQDAIIMIDNRGKVSFWNEAAEKILGYSAQEITGKEMHLILGPQRYHQAYREGFKKFMATGKGAAIGKTLELAAVRKDGTQFPVELSLAAVQLKGKWNAIGILRDISGRKQKEAELKQSNEKLRQAYEDLKNSSQELQETQNQLIQAGKLAAIGQLAAGVSHELNNPLGGILGYAQFIMEKAKRKEGLENLTPKELQSIQTYISYIERESQRCKAIVSNLLKFARSTKNDRKAPLDINQVLEDTFTFTKHQLEINQMALVKTLAPNLPRILGNAHQLQQVFTNIIVNAQQAMSRGGTLTVSSKLKKNNFIEISFADTGCGISQDNIHKLFEPFFTTKEVGKGTGLGLSVSYGIIKDHKGDIEVESMPDKGSVFRITLPVQDAADTQA